MSWMQALYRLQEVDLALAEARKQLQEVELLLKDDQELQQARQEVTAAETILRQAQKVQKDLEFELNRVETERKQAEQRLYSGTIRNPREMEDLQAKTQSLKRRKSELEDKLLEAMLAREEANETHEAALDALEAVTKRWGATQTQLKATGETLRAQIAALETEGKKQAREVPPATLETYRYLQSKMGVRVVARVDGEVCSVCGIDLTGRTRRNAKEGKETYCDSCERLLVA